MQRRTFIRASIAGLSSAIGCNTGGANMANGSGESLAALSAELKLQFPSSTRLIGVHRSPGGMDDAVRVKLELSTGELPFLLSQTQIETEAFERGTGGLMGP